VATRAVLGPPGTGKTTTLLQGIEVALQGGTSPEQMAFLSFTKKAVREATSRSLDRFNWICSDDLQYFRTIHSLCFFLTGARRDGMMTGRHYKEIADLAGMNFEPVRFDDSTGLVFTNNKMIQIEQMARLTCTDIEDVWQDAETDIPLYALRFFVDTVRDYKEAHGLTDFTDLLYNFLEYGEAPYLDHLFIDEAQDLTPLQWKVIDKLQAYTENTTIAGDDDQAIFGWAGADVDTFIQRCTDGHVLEVSHRVPACILDIANGIIQDVKNRIPKNVTSAMPGGEIDTCNEIESIEDLRRGSWLVLARNNYHLDSVKESLVSMGLVYEAPGDRPQDREDIKAAFLWERIRKTGEKPFKKDLDLIERFTDSVDYSLPWFEALTGIDPVQVEYIRSILRNKEDIKNPRIKLSTIHGAKGGEADNVLLLTDQTRKTSESAQVRPDDEKRVYYVGVTRARKTLHILTPRGNNFFSF
jgi:superfamily I DNA/RNA helicase